MAALNPLKARLAAGEAVSVCLVSSPSVPSALALARAGFDGLMFDLEHCPITIETAQAMIAATLGAGCTPLVRVPWNVPWLAKPVLDAGAMGVIFPMVTTAQEAAAAVAAVRYPPVGERGFGPIYAAPAWGVDLGRYGQIADEEVLCIALIEHQRAIANLEEIVAVPGLDVAALAPFDLAYSYGKRGPRPGDPDLAAAVERFESVVGPSPVILGGGAGRAEDTARMIERGYRFLIAGMDVAFLQAGAARALAPFKAAQAPPPNGS
ncbi:MAG: HpcH/HpaI aldolase family protein [Acidimicrobiales bacterium]